MTLHVEAIPTCNKKTFVFLKVYNPSYDKEIYILYLKKSSKEMLRKIWYPSILFEMCRIKAYFILKYFK